MSTIPSTVPSCSTDSDALRRCSVETNNTSTSDFLAAVATEPPRVEDYKGYPSHEVHWPLPQRRNVDEPSDEIPSPEKLAEASTIPILDGDGNQITFRDLYLKGNYLGERRLILFIRHWYCRGCQEYISCLKDLIAANEDLNSAGSTKIILIGIGHPSLIKAYARQTDCPYPIYTEPTLQLLRILGCRRWGGLVYRFGKRPTHSIMNTCELGFQSLFDKYRSVFSESLGANDSSDEHSDGSIHSRATLESQLRKRPSLDYLRAGPVFQVGGEFLFEDGQLIWCHRMKGMRTHTDLKTLRKVLEIQDGPRTDPTLIETRMESKWMEQELRERGAQGRPLSKELRRKAEKLCKAYDASRATREALARPISDEEEDRYLEQQLGRKRSLASVHNGMRVVREADGRARLRREEPKLLPEPGLESVQGFGDGDML